MEGRCACGGYVCIDGGEDLGWHNPWCGEGKVESYPNLSTSNKKEQENDRSGITRRDE